MKIDIDNFKKQMIKSIRSAVVLGSIKLSTKVVKEIMTYIQRKLYLVVEESQSTYYRNLIYEWLLKIDEKKYKDLYSKTYIRTGTKLKRGIYFLKYKKNYVLINNLSKAEYVDSGQKVTIDALKLYIFGKDPENVLMDIINIKETVEEQAYINYVSINPTPPITNYKYISGRGYDTVFSEQKDIIIAHMQRWMNQRKFYQDAGVTYKDGILVHGKPGCGKSSMAKVLASLYNAQICYLDVSDPEQAIKIIDNFNNSYKINSMHIIVIEEIDYPLKINGFKETFESKITQLLDGINSPSNVYFYFTTNDISVIPKKWLRIGRLSAVVEMTYINKDTALEACDYYKVDPDIILKDKTFPTEPSQLINDILDYINKNNNTEVKELVDQALRQAKTNKVEIKSVARGITSYINNGN